MRVLIDLQSVQGATGSRGIGRYALALTHGIVRNRGAHDIHIALSDLFPEATEPVRGEFFGHLPAENIHIWTAQPGVAGIDPSNDVRRENAEALREAFIASLRPDIAIVTSVFAGFGDDTVTSVKDYANIPTAAILYDLIPLIYKDRYLSNAVEAAWYYQKLAQLKRADVLLAISDSSRTEGIELLGIDPERIVDIGAAADPYFRPRKVSESNLRQLSERYCLKRDFLMYTGAFDWRKNIEGLIRAYAGIPKSLRRKCQLAVVCAVKPEERSKLEQICRASGLGHDEVVVTGFVPDDDLLTLYNACLAFVFPSLHEGFGLPALEAMQCGKAVIASRTSSLPDVVGRRDALFDPIDESAITGALKRVIEDNAYRTELERHGPVQAAKFSWDESAQRAIAGIESAVGKLEAAKARHRIRERKRLAYVSPLPPERSGISDYSAELLPALNEFYEIDVIVRWVGVLDDWIVANCRQRDIDWFRVHFGEYDRIVYHFGNSTFHEHMFELLEYAPGSVVLHDFSLSEILGCRGNDILLQALKTSHGFHAVVERLTSGAATYIYPANLAVLQNSVGLIVHSENSRRLANEWYGEGAGDDWAVIPSLRASSQLDDHQRANARKLLRVPKDALLLCSFGILAPMKLNDRLIRAFLASQLAQEPKVQLVFVGENHDEKGEYAQKLRKIISGSGIGERIRVTGWVDRETFETYLRAADLAIQLRGLSRGESSRTVLDCMSHGLATVVNANGAMADIDRAGVWMLDDHFEDNVLTEALEQLAHDTALRAKIGIKAQEIIRTHHSPAHCAALYFDAIEGFYARDANEVGGLVRRLSKMGLTESDVRSLASALSRNFPPRPRLRQLLVDVSAIVIEDLNTGIQRVVHAILGRWLLNPPAGWSVEPVYSSPEQAGYRYARRFTCDLLGVDDSWAEDEAVDAWPDDKFVGLDWSGQHIAVQQSILEGWYRVGVDIRFVVYDLLPVRTPDFFPGGSESRHLEYLRCITSFNGAVCISQTVARELREWCVVNASPRSVPFAIDWFHLGADMRTSRRSSGIPDDPNRSLPPLDRAPTFLMVGTVEPRKGHRQALGAFEILWEKRIDVNLVIVGKRGWMVEDFVERVRHHPELEARLFWPEDVSDEYLEQLYAAGTCLIAASEGEGFGLPLIEAAQHHLPIIARDLPVFREVAGEYAFYFSGEKTSDLAEALSVWLKLYRKGKHIRSDGMTWLTWAQSAQMLLGRLGIELGARSEAWAPSKPGRA